MNQPASTCGVCGAATEDYACRECARDLEKWIAEMPFWLDQLIRFVAPRQTRVYRAAGLRRGEDDETGLARAGATAARLRSRDGQVALRAFAAPVDFDAADLLDRARNELVNLVRHLEESRGTSHVGDPLVWLATYARAFALDESAAGVWRQVWRLRCDLERAVDRSPTRLYTGPCGGDVETVVTEVRDGTEYSQTMRTTCERDLYRYLNAAEVTCDGYRQDGRGCRSVHNVAAREAWFRDSLDDSLAPMGDWQHALPRMFPAADVQWPHRTTWERWAVNERLIQAHGHDRHGRALFRGGDVFALVAGHRDRAARTMHRLRRVV